MGNSLKFAGFLGRVFLVNTAAGVGAATGIIGTAVLAAKFARPQLKKVWDAIPVPNFEDEKEQTSK